MKKTIKIKLGGVIFHIDEDAYEMLKSYLDSLKDHFRGMEEGQEVINDIEIRIAEIFEQKSGDQDKVIEKDDVKKMIDTMGEARDIIDEEENGSYRRTYRRMGKRFYRDPDNTVLGGVCGGLGAYFNVDPIWFRLLFLILIFAYGAGLVYIILWIVIPKAETATQKLEMKGENVTVHNIERTIKEEYDSVKGNFRKIKDSNAYNKTTDAVNEIFRGIGNVILIFLKIILTFIGIVLILVGLTVLTSFFVALLFSNTLFFPDLFDVPRFYLPHILPIFTSLENVTIVMIALLIAVTIPLIALIYGGIKLIFRFKVKDKVIGLIAFLVWFLSIIILVVIVGIEASNYESSARVTHTYKLKTVENKVLYLDMNESRVDLDRENFVLFEINNDGVYRDPESGIIYGKPRLDVVESESGGVELEFLKRSRGRNRDIARDHARELEYIWNQRDSLVVFDRFFSLPKDQRWRSPYINIELKLPLGYAVHFDEDMTAIIKGIGNVSHTRSYDMVGKTWLMTEEGLTQIFPQNY